MNLRQRIEQAKMDGTRIRKSADRTSTTYRSEMDRLAREKAQLEAKEILEGLPALILQRAEDGHGSTFEVCDIGEISTIGDLRGKLDHPGHYVLEALEAEGYKLDVGIDCSGNWSSHNSLTCAF